MSFSTPVSEGAALIWKNLSVFEPNHGCRLSPELREQKRILKGIHGAIYYRSLNAIMGPSGSGKTTLLKCLFGTSSIKYTGSIFVGDKSTKAVLISQNEEDHLLLNLTVEESIRFASKVKNNSSCRFIHKCMDSDLVSSLIDQLDLERCRHTLVGKCSGGQKKRLAIAQELASNVKPKVIFMDEPTSGKSFCQVNLAPLTFRPCSNSLLSHLLPSCPSLSLYCPCRDLAPAGIDSSVSHMVLKQLQSLAQRSGIAILCTIHQPSYKILELFDQLYILSRRGRAIYSGKPHRLRHHLLRYSLQCPDGHNPGDVIIELASTETKREFLQIKPGCFGFCSKISVDGHERELSPTSEIQRIETLEKVAEIETEEIAERLCTPTMIEVRKLCSYRMPRTLFHAWFLFKRSFLNSVWREPRWLVIRFVLHLFAAFVLSFLYDGSIGQDHGCMSLISQSNETSFTCKCPTTRDTLASLHEENVPGKNVAFLFFNLMFLMFAALMPTVLTFPTEMKVFLNEHRNGWYSTHSYFWAKNLVEFIVQLPLPYVYSLYIYWWTRQLGLSSLQDALPVGQNSRFIQFVSVTILSSYIAQGIGLMIGAIFAYNFNVSIFVSTIFMMFTFLFSGFFIRIRHMGTASFVTNLSFTRFAFEAVLIAVYGDRCTSPTQSSIFNSSDSSTASPLPSAESLVWKPMTTMNLTRGRGGNSSLLTTSTSTTTASPESFTSPGDEVISVILYQFGVKSDNFQRSIIWLLVHLIGWRVCAYLTLWWQANPDSFHRKIFFFYYQMKNSTTKKLFLTTFSCFLFVLLFCVLAALLFLFLYENNVH